MPSTNLEKIYLYNLWPIFKLPIGLCHSRHNHVNVSKLSKNRMIKFIGFPNFRLFLKLAISLQVKRLSFSVKGVYNI